MKITYKQETPEQLFKFVVGRLYQNESDGELYICCLLFDEVNLISLNSGKRWTCQHKTLESLYNECGEDFHCVNGKATIENF